MGESVHNYFFFSETGGSFLYIANAQVTSYSEQSAGSISVAFEDTFFLTEFETGGTVTFGNDILDLASQFTYSQLVGNRYSRNWNNIAQWFNTPYLRLVYEGVDFTPVYSESTAFYAPSSQFPYPYPILTLSSLNNLAATDASCTLQTSTAIDTVPFGFCVNTDTVNVYNTSFNQPYFSFNTENFTDGTLTTPQLASTDLSTPVFQNNLPLFFASNSTGEFKTFTSLNTTSYYTLSVPAGVEVYAPDGSLPLGGNYITSMNDVYNTVSNPVTLYTDETTNPQSVTSTQTWAVDTTLFTGPFVNEGPDPVSGVYSQVRVDGKTFTSSPTLPTANVLQIYSVTGSTVSQGTFNFQLLDQPFVTVTALGYSFNSTDVQQLSLTDPHLSLTIQSQAWLDDVVLVAPNAPLASLPYFRGPPASSVTAFGSTTQSITPLIDGAYSLTLNFETAGGPQSIFLFGGENASPPVPPAPSTSSEMPAGLVAFLWISVAFAIVYAVFLGIKVAVLA